MTRNELKDIIRECLIEEGYCFNNESEDFSLINQSNLQSVSEECLLEMSGIGTYIEEKAKFSFLPKIKEDPNLKELYNAASEAETLLNSEGEETKTGLHKLGKLALRIIDIFQNISSAIALPACILIAPIPVYLITRAMNYAVKIGQDAIAAGYAKKILTKYGELAKKEEDPKKKKIYEDKIEKIKSTLNKYNQE